MAAVPERVLAYVDTVADEVAAVVGVDLTGVYTTGSLALGDFHPGRSDIDLIAIVARPVAPSLRDEVVGRLDDERLACPAAGLEFVLYPTATVARPTLEAGYLLNLNTGRDLPRVVAHVLDHLRGLAGVGSPRA